MTDFDLEVRTRIPVGHYKTLCAAAAKHDTTVSALVAELVRRGVTGEAPGKRPTRGRATPETLNELVRLQEVGRTDQEIAYRVGMSHEWVRLHRKKLGLPANRRAQ